ncbi:hypothetical protein MKX01_023789 [Papaver californicum]|nr:hypothetical protein MKX01_023789 [Papaver californicum]
MLDFFIQQKGSFGFTSLVILSLCVLGCMSWCVFTFDSVLEYFKAFYRWGISYTICTKSFCKGSMIQLKKLGKPEIGLGKSLWRS